MSRNERLIKAELMRELAGVADSINQCVSAARKLPAAALEYDSGYIDAMAPLDTLETNLLLVPESVQKICDLVAEYKNIGDVASKERLKFQAMSRGNDVRMYK